MLHGVIFDLDGTLGDTLPVCYRAFARVFRRRLGVHYTDRQIHAMFGPTEEGILARLCPGSADEALAEYLGEYRRAHAVCPRPFEGIPALLAGLRRRGIKLAIVTGKGPGSARITLDTFGIGDHFSIIEAGSPSGGVKPACMRRVLACWGLPPQAVAGVGDSPSDIRSGREVGIRSVAAAWAPGADAVLLRDCGPDRLFTDVQSFRNWALAQDGDRQT